MRIETIHNTILQSCTYILYDDSTNDCYLIDCGDVEPINEFLKSQTKELKGIFLTHSHYDHIYGLSEIVKSHPDVIIYASLCTIDGLADSDINLSYMYDDGDYIVEDTINCDIYKKSVHIFGKDVYPVSTPGHDQDCTTYIIANSIFTGDSYNPDYPVFTKWRRSNEADAEKSIVTILQLVEEKHLTIYPGHY